MMWLPCLSSDAFEWLFLNASVQKVYSIISEYVLIYSFPLVWNVANEYLDFLSIY